VVSSNQSPTLWEVGKTAGQPSQTYPQKLWLSCGWGV